MGNSKPDMYYKDKDVIIIGEAKANKDDLRKGYNPNHPENLHLAKQMNDYITYLMTQKKKKRKNRIILLAIPFFLSSMARQILRKTLKQHDQSSNNNGWKYSEWFDESDDHMMHVPDGNGEIKIGFVYETDSKIIKNIKTEKPGNVVDDTIYNDHKVYKVKRITLNIEDEKDKIKYALDNPRFMDIDDSREYNQRTAESELLGEFDNIEDSVDALTRKKAFLSEQCIQKPLFAYVDSDGDYVVYDGNSRLANAYEIIRHAKKADGYAINTMIVLPKDISQAELAYLKADAQQPTVMNHSKSQRAIEIYRIADGDANNADRIVGRFRIRTERTAKCIIETVNSIIEGIEGNAGRKCNKDDIHTYYDAMYNIVAAYEKLSGHNVKSLLQDRKPADYMKTLMPRNDGNHDSDAGNHGDNGDEDLNDKDITKKTRKGVQHDIQ